MSIVGDGPERAGLVQLARELGVTDRVNFAGLVAHDDLLPYYQSASAFCFPSASEAAATAPIEALACGLPVVATPAGILGELLTAHDVGALVPEDSDAIAEAMLRITADRQQLAKRSEAARRLAEERFDWKRIVAAYSEVYEEAVSRRTGSVRRPPSGATSH